jgi:hypothetical protein
MRRFWCERMVWARRCGGWVLSRLVCVGEFKAMLSDFLGSKAEGKESGKFVSRFEALEFKGRFKRSSSLNLIMQR